MQTFQATTWLHQPKSDPPLTSTADWVLDDEDDEAFYDDDDEDELGVIVAARILPRYLPCPVPTLPANEQGWFVGFLQVFGPN